ncbi:MAG: nucleotide sugar dehydrogenase, partial [Methanomicrobium sp.]|nr:nucleotide sugar dehydrogenase [Methanomicrobium sp.]
NASLLHTGITAAEMIKYASNAFLATKISFSNEIGNICKSLCIDVYEVMKGVGMDHRISPYFLNAGAGFGGSCFPKDVSALVSLAKEKNQNPVLLKSVLDVNKTQPLKMTEILKSRTGSLKDKKIAVLGLAFKDNTDDIRDSRSIPVINALLLEEADVYAFDPLASENMKSLFPQITYCSSASDALKDADGCLVMTEWPQFSKLNEEFNQMKSKIIIEGRRILTIDEKEGICW